MSQPTDSPYVNQSAAQLVAALSKHAQVGSQLHSEIIGALAAVLVKDLTSSIDRHEQAASKLSNQLLWLNIILGIFTVAGTVFGLISFFSV